MSKDLERKFGVTEVTNKNYDTLICKECGGPYGEHFGTDCGPKEKKVERSPVEHGVIKPCPFKEVEKDCGHKPYTLAIDKLWHVQCTCGARGPISPTADYAIDSWNKMAL